MDLNDPAHRGHSNHVITTNGIEAKRIWVPEVPILESVVNELILLAQTHIFECCGFIDSNWEVWKIPNSHEEPTHNYYMSPEDAGPILTDIYEEQQNTVIAQFHTHPNGVPWPSPRDIRGWPNPDLEWRYLIATPKEVLEWELSK